MTEQIFGIVNPDGVVINKIIADQNFIDSIADQIQDPNTDTGSLTTDNTYVDFTGKNVSVGWRRVNGKFVAPEPLPPTPEELERDRIMRETEAQNRADVARVGELRKLVGPGKPGLTQAQRDELNLLLLSRDISI